MPNKVNLQPVKDAFASAGHKINPKNWSPKARAITLIALGAIAAAGLAAAIVFHMPIAIIGAAVVLAVVAGLAVANRSLNKRLAAEAVEANKLSSRFLKHAKAAMPTLGIAGLIGANIALVAGFSRKA